jgi:hypothetical protein
VVIVDRVPAATAADALVAIAAAIAAATVVTVAADLTGLPKSTWISS